MRDLSRFMRSPPDGATGGWDYALTRPAYFLLIYISSRLLRTRAENFLEEIAAISMTSSPERG